MKINKRKIQHASLSVVFIAVFVALILLFNVLVGYLTNRFSLKIDLTPEGAYTLSEETVELLKELDEDVMIYIMQSEATIQKSEAKQNIVENIRRYSTQSGNKIKYEFIDPNQNPKFYDDYPLAKATGEGQSAAFLIVKSDRRYTTVMYNSLIAQNETGNAIYYSTESELSGAIMHVTSEEISKVGLIIGHDEYTVPAFQTILDGNKFETVEVNLSKEDIPEDVNNLLISAPSFDYTADEIAKIDEFLAVPGNNAYIFWGAAVAQHLPVLERFLADWGMAIEPTVILDQERCYMNQYGYSDPTTVGGIHVPGEVTENIPSSQKVLLCKQSHPISILWEEKSYTKVTPLAITYSSSYARAFDSGINIYEAHKNDEAKGPFNVAVLAEKTKINTNGEPEYNRVFLFGTQGFADENIVGVAICNNNELLNSVVSYANKQTKTMSIAPKIIQKNDLNFYRSHINIIMIILVIIVPIVFLAAGVYIFLRRRHR